MVDSGREVEEVMEAERIIQSWLDDDSEYPRYPVELASTSDHRETIAGIVELAQGRAG